MAPEVAERVTAPAEDLKASLHLLQDAEELLRDAMRERLGDPYRIIMTDAHWRHEVERWLERLDALKAKGRW